jgi:hypothetical protein
MLQCSITALRSGASEELPRWTFDATHARVTVAGSGFDRAKKNASAKLALSY